jgi:hypothetical protein
VTFPDAPAELIARDGSPIDGDALGRWLHDPRDGRPNHRLNAEWSPLWNAPGVLAPISH